MSNQASRCFYLAIRHRPSGGFLPNVRGYGFTRTEPTLTEPPRLFTKKGPATQALKYWLQGELSEKLDYDSDFATELTLHCKRRPDRNAEDMEIVEIELISRSLTEAQLRIL
jgi:hypothetical protein